MRWNQGRSTIEHLLAGGDLERIPANREHADALVAEGEDLLDLASEIADRNPRYAFGTLYEAAHLALTGVLANQGLRPTQDGGHVALYEAIRAQLDPPMGAVIRPFNEMRRTRHTTKYWEADSPMPTVQEFNSAFPRAKAIVELAANVLDQMDVF